MTRDEAIAILQEEIDGNLELTIREWRERDEQRLFPALRMAIESLQDRPKGDWIPCSERMPSEDGDYLVCNAWTYSNINVLSWADGWNCHRCYDGKISRESKIDGTNILAWMPLPTPYKGGDDE